MKILYVGPIWEGSTALYRMKALENYGFEIISLDSTMPKLSWLNLFRVRIENRLGIWPDILGINDKILETIQRESINILWIDKGLTLKAEVLRKIKLNKNNVLIIAYSPDDMLNPRNQSKQYLKSIPIYDLHITTKSFNVNELKSLGAQDVLFISNSYYPVIHRPLNLSELDKEKYFTEVGFIGAFEKDRFEKMLFLAESGIKLTIRGDNRWNKYVNLHKNMVIKSSPVWGEEYVKAINATSINLCFLRKVNRDLQTARSVEIPGCKSFMLAERTREHLELFSEGIEADYFSSQEELLGKVNYYLDNANKRIEIAKNAYERCKNSGYSNYNRIKHIIKYLETKTNYPFN